MNRNISRILVFVISTVLISCSGGVHKYVKKGDKKLKRGEFQTAIEKYEEALSDGADTVSAAKQIGEAFRYSNRINQGLPYFEYLVKSGKADDETVFYYAEALRTTGNYEAAKEWYGKYLKSGQSTSKKNVAKLQLKNLDKVADISKRKNYFEISNVDVVNSPAADFSPVIFNQELIFTTAKNSTAVFAGDGKGFTGLFTFKFDDASEKTGVAVPFGEFINLPKRHQASATFSKDGKTMIFARGNDGRKKGDQDVNLYVSKFKEGIWTEPEFLKISDPNAWDACPSFSTDGKTLYFSSNREGGRGGIDIYQSKMDRRGNFRRVRNMGKTINTPGNEMFPYISDDRKLYFSSDGHPGIGGLDLFVAEREGKKVQISNMGVPMNSNLDDFGITYINEKEGYFSSNREGGKGDDDIYKFINNSPDFKVAFYFMSATIVDDASGAPIPNAKVKLFDSRGSPVTEANADAEGKFRYQVQPGQNYTVITEDENHLTANTVFSTIGKTKSQDDLPEFENDVDLPFSVRMIKKEVNLVIVLENIYYDYNSAEIRDDAAEELDNLYTLLQDNLDMRIELSSHTDSRGDGKYNQKLSQKRAESAKNYMVERGVADDRIIPKGYGESRLIIENAQTEDQHQKNRRTEFKILGFDAEQAPEKVPEKSQEENPEGE
jgi:peptidoglycan-associated lipoprotein